ncbi:MAG: hypothetical protein QNL70_11075 [Pseudomonas sp.]
MKIRGRIEVDTVTNVLCDVCDSSTLLESGGLHYGYLKACWGYGTKHDGERYEVHLCEGCFFKTIAYLKQERRNDNLFDDRAANSNERFGLIAKNVFWGDE